MNKGKAIYNAKIKNRVRGDGLSRKSKADLLFECSWEVCNKVGGIYTVVMSKAAQMKRYVKDYVLIGPYFEDKAKLEFEPMKVPEEIQKAFDTLEKEGIRCVYGKWKVKGEPTVILIDSDNLKSKKDEIKILPRSIRKWLLLGPTGKRSPRAPCRSGETAPAGTRGGYRLISN
jgi:hypothetical protein